MGYMGFGYQGTHANGAGGSRDCRGWVLGAIGMM